MSQGYYQPSHLHSFSQIGESRPEEIVRKHDVTDEQREQLTQAIHGFLRKLWQTGLVGFRMAAAS